MSKLGFSNAKYRTLVSSDIGKDSLRPAKGLLKQIISHFDNHLKI